MKKETIQIGSLLLAKVIHLEKVLQQINQTNYLSITFNTEEPEGRMGKIDLNVKAFDSETIKTFNRNLNLFLSNEIKKLNKEIENLKEV